MSFSPLSSPIPQAPLLPSTPPTSLNLHRPLHHTPSPQAKDPLEEADEEGETADLDGPEPEIEGINNISRQETNPSSADNIETSSEEYEDSSAPPSGRRGRKMKTYEEIDASMSLEELGLKSMLRKRKREFIRWLMQEGVKDSRFPQHILQDLESRRIEKIRKAAEIRMFNKMNKFFNTLSFEEIQTGQLELAKEGDKGEWKGTKWIKERTERSEPSPFQKLMNGEVRTRVTSKELESRVLGLLEIYDGELHRMYRKYIDWSDYQLQKRQLFFIFPKGVSQYADINKRFRGLKSQYKGEDNVFGKEKEETFNEESKLDETGSSTEGQITNLLETETSNTEISETEPAKIQLNETESTTARIGETVEPSMELNRKETSTSAPVVTASPVEGFIKANSTEEPSTTEEPTPTKDPTKEFILFENSNLVKPNRNDDLAYHHGQKLDSKMRFPILPINSTNYNQTGKLPMIMNQTFKPWRPIITTKRLRMFDAWREGLDYAMWRGWAA